MPAAKTIITCLESILPLFQTNIKHGLKDTNRLIFTNKYPSTLCENKHQIEELKRIRNCTFVASYEPVLDHYRKQRKGQGKQGEAVLLVGQPCFQLGEQLKGEPVITLEQMCALFPEKVPLSYRNKQNEQLRKRLQIRTGLPLSSQPHIGHILYTGSNITMWDEAIQVVLDHQPATNILEFQQPQPPSPYYKLSMQDFLKAVSKCYSIVHPGQGELPGVVDFNSANRQAEWFVEREGKGKGTIVVDEDLVNDKEALVRKYGHVEIERVDENSSLWA